MKTTKEPKITFSFDDEHYEFDPESLIIDHDNLSSEFITHPSRYQRASQFCALALSRLFTKKMQLEYLDAKLGRKYRKKGIPGVEKMTETAIMQAITLNKKRKKLQEEVYKATRDAEILKGLVKAFEARTSMLLSLGAMMRKEVDDIRVNVTKEYGEMKKKKKR